MLNENLRMMEKVEEYINIAKEKVKYHHKNALNSLNCYNTLSILNVIITGTQGLTMTIQSVNNEDSRTVAITGGAFACVLLILNRVQTSFAFNALSIQHNNLVDDYTELMEQFKLVINDIENNNYDQRLYDQLVRRYISVQEKNHLLQVRGVCCSKFICGE